MQTILIVEDDNITRQMLKEALESANYLTIDTANAKRCMEIFTQQNIDMVVLDIGLPDGNGIDLVQKIKKIKDIPIVVSTGENDIKTKVKGFDMGIDDYIVKPYNINELLARIEANIKCYERLMNKNIKEREKKDFSYIGKWKLDRTKFDIFDRDNIPAGLTFIEFKILDTFIQNSGKVLKRSDLCNAISDGNSGPTPRSIDIRITRMRKKLGDNAVNPQIIKTVRGVGYILQESLLNNSEL